MTRRAPGFAALAALALALGACASLPPRAPAGSSAIDSAADWPARRVALLALNDFALRGRVAVAAGGEGFSVTLRWTQHGAAGQMQLAGPLGTGGLQVQIDGAELRVTDAHGEQLSGAPARAELERRLGFELPLVQLAYWVRGVAEPGAAYSETLDAEGKRLASLQQAGWRIDYATYAPSPPGVLPSKLVLLREGVRIRLIVDGWESP